MNRAASGKRAYASPLRAQQAAATRWAVLRAAATLFVHQGYVATSISEIARAAGVGRATVASSVGTKPTLLKQAYDTAIAGDDDPTPIPERALPFREQTDPHAVLDAYATHSTTIDSRVAGLAEAVRGAAGADADARALWEETQQQRRNAAGVVVDAVTAVGELRPGLDRDEAVDLVWVLIDPSWYHSLVTIRAWSLDHFRDWRARTLCAQLLSTEDGG